MTVPVIRQRAKAPKTKTGCRTCRVRRVKCDEARPQCNKCLSGGRECGGYEVGLPVSPAGTIHKRVILPRNDSLTPDLGIVKAPPNLPITLTSQEDCAIQFFRSQSLYQIPGYTSTTSWEKLVMQVSHTEPAMMHAVVAVGFMHQARAVKPKNAMVAGSDWADSEFALRHFSKALSRINKYIQEMTSNGYRAGIEIVLLACLMFSSFEALRGFDESANRHRQAGLKVLLEYLNSGSQHDSAHVVELKNAPESSMDVLVEAFMRLDSDSTMVGEFEPRLSVSCDRKTSTLRAFLPMSFHSLEEARMHLDALTNALYRTRGKLLRLAEVELASRMDVTGMDDDWHHGRVQAGSRTVDISAYPNIPMEMEQVEYATLAWESAFASMEISRRDIRYQAWLLFQIQYFLTWIQVMTWRDVTEVMIDRFSSRFPHALDLIEQFAQSMFLGDSPCHERRTFWLGGCILMPLYFIGIKCRDTQVRRGAIELLKKLNLQEGQWDSDLLAVYTERVANIEEERARAINSFASDQDLACADVPEEARFWDITISGQLEHLKIGKLVVARLVHAQDSELTFEEHCFPMPEE